jgi:hypothetical protein
MLPASIEMRSDSPPLATLCSLFLPRLPIIREHVPALRARKGGGLTVEEMLEGAYYNGKGDAGN